ncbi:MMPL family transporter [Streptomyces sp. NPDC005181]|uniref:MMPL family transporter n=1 Tax=Streptomyces sp. NPDC005181 TaxID=3156869 RepID=UPI00339FC9A7
MAAFLYRLGRLAFRRRWYVALLWAAVLGAVGFSAVTAPAAPDEGSSMPGIESQKAFDLMEQRFPGSMADGASARIVFVAPDGQKVTAAGNRSAIEKTVDEAADGTQVAGAVSPFQAQSVSKDASTAYATVTYKVKADDLTDASKQTLEDAIQEARDAGLSVEVGGTALATQPAAGGGAEGIGIAIAAVVLLMTFGSLAAAGLPLLTAIIGVGVSMASILALGSALGLSATTGTLATMLGLACGIDYAVFIVSRYREERAKGHAPQEAVVTGFRYSARVVVAAALIMMAVFSGFIGAGESMIKTIGFGLATAVLFDAFVVRMAFVPAVLALLGKAAWWLPRPLDKLLPRVDVEGEALSRRSAAPARTEAADLESVRV